MTPDMTVLNINCGPKSSCIPSDVVGKDDRPEKRYINHDLLFSVTLFYLMLVFPDPDFPMSKTFFLFMIDLQ